ncbi:purine-nucleoside phosphorylase [candidate division KSB1 bacterium]|nr:purine-nucleoside phosphorylase [candidate division KSB1 bacterium]
MPLKSPYPIERQLPESISFIKNNLSIEKPIAIILGSGLGGFASVLESPRQLLTSQIPHYPISTVEGHAGRWILGTLNRAQILVLQGRVHFYEGYTMQQVVYPIHLLADLGVETLIVTNAAGGINRQYLAGDLMLILDHVNLMSDNPLIGPHIPRFGPRFPDMSAPYYPPYLAIAEQAALDLKIKLQQGVLFASKGPSYETAAEVHMLRMLGADAITMSTVPEVIAAVQRGLKVLGISCISNLATGLNPEKLDHQEVTATAKRIQENFVRFMIEFIIRIQKIG